MNIYFRFSKLQKFFGCSNLPCLLFLSFFPLSSLLLSSSAIASKNICPKIACDCDSLQVDAWRQSCAAHELTIKKNCQSNQNVPRDYCAIHGPAARPLPLLTTLDDVAVLPQKEIALSNRKIASIYWSIKSDAKLVSGRLEEASYGVALDVLKAIELNTVTLFKIQRAVALSSTTYENEKIAKKQWRNYAEDSAEIEKDLAKVLGEWLARLEKATSDDEKTAYRLSILKLYRIQGHLAEQSALAYGYSDNHTKSARQWSVASRNSMRLLAFSERSGSESKFIDYFRHQAATRLQRVSYQWQLADETSKANEALELSRPYEDEPDVIEVWLLDETQDDASDKRGIWPFRR